MKKRFSLVLALVSMFAAARLQAGDAKADLQELKHRVEAKLDAGKASEAELADELRSFDTILAVHQDEKTEAAASILFAKAELYGEVLFDESKAIECLQQLQKDFAGTTSAGKARNYIATLSRQSNSNKLRRLFIPGTNFLDFHETDLDGKPLSLENYKGKVVLIDFWATWCGPCVGELPNVKKVYDKYRGKGFEVVGVSLDKDREILTRFIAENRLAWPQYFDGKGWGNKLSSACGIRLIPAIFLVGRDGKILRKGLRGDALEEAVKTALATP